MRPDSAMRAGWRIAPNADTGWRMRTVTTADWTQSARGASGQCNTCLLPQKVRRSGYSVHDRCASTVPGWRWGHWCITRTRLEDEYPAVESLINEGLKKRSRDSATGSRSRRRMNREHEGLVPRRSICSSHRRNHRTWTSLQEEFISASPSSQWKGNPSRVAGPLRKSHRNEAEKLPPASN